MLSHISRRAKLLCLLNVTGTMPQCRSGTMPLNVTGTMPFGRPGRLWRLTT